MKVSIITSVLNGAGTIEDCIRSVLNQTYHNTEYIIIDGGSTDGTREIIKKYEGRLAEYISEPDNGIYDALNKGISLATGDLVGFLHADDFYASDSVIENIAAQMAEQNADSCYGDLLYVDKDNPDKTIRFWKSGPYRSGLFRKGWMPPHPTFFVRREIYDQYGHFNTDFRIAADYELMLRFIARYKISAHYIPDVFIKMRIGGLSNRSMKSLMKKTSEDYRAWKVNNLNRSFYTIPLKNISKIPQFFKR